MTTTPQAAPLTKSELRKVLQRTAESIDSCNIVMTHWELVARSVEQALLAKLQATQAEPVAQWLAWKENGGMEWRKGFYPEHGQLFYASPPDANGNTVEFTRAPVIVSQADHVPEAGKMVEPAQVGDLPPYIYGREAGPNEKVWTEQAVRSAIGIKPELNDPVRNPSAEVIEASEQGGDLFAIEDGEYYPHNGPYRAVQLAPVAQEPAQAGELPDEREAFKSWMRENTRYGIFSSYGELGWSVWQAATARAAIAESQAKQVTPSTFALQALVNMLDMAYQVQQNDEMAIVFEPETKARIAEAKAELAALAARKPLSDDQIQMFKSAVSMLTAYMDCIKTAGDYQSWHYIPEIEDVRNELAAYACAHGINGLEVKP